MASGWNRLDLCVTRQAGGRVAQLLLLLSSGTLRFLSLVFIRLYTILTMLTLIWKVGSAGLGLSSVSLRGEYRSQSNYQCSALEFPVISIAYYKGAQNPSLISEAPT